MKLSDFDYKLPKELIAQTPAQPRDHSRLLIYDRKTKQITDDYFYNLDKYLTPETTIVLNDSKVEKCRLRFGTTEIFVLGSPDPYTVKALVRPGKRFKTGTSTSLSLGGLRRLRVETLSTGEGGIRILKLSRPLNDPALEKFKLTPLPPYIKQDESLSEQYQTVYAKPPGSKAAPTAGLHFTDALLKDLAKTHSIVNLTLHIGLGTFAPVKTEDIGKHKIHSEEFILSAETARRLNRAKHITAVGTTSLRVLEAAGRPFRKAAGATDIFITPGYKFGAVDSLVTNFHLPKSTLLMLVAAYVGSVDEAHKIYKHAIAENYRFYSFGDAMLIL